MQRAAQAASVIHMRSYFKSLYIRPGSGVFTERRKVDQRLQTFIAFYETNRFHTVFTRVLYGCETWSVTLREDRKLRVFENTVFRKIFGPRRDEVTGEWRGLHNEELNDLYSSPNIVRVIKSRRTRLAGHVARMGEERGRIGSCWGNRRERAHWGDLGVDGWILGWISRMRVCGLDWAGTG